MIKYNNVLKNTAYAQDKFIIGIQISFMLAMWHKSLKYMNKNILALLYIMRTKWIKFDEIRAHSQAFPKF